MNTSNKKADFLIEIGTEELPPKALKSLAQTFHTHLLNGLDKGLLQYSGSQWFASPRRLAVWINDLALEQPEQKIQKLGPVVDKAYDQDGNPTSAAIGFARSCGLEITELEKIETDKGVRLGIEHIQPGKEASALLGTLVQNALKNLPIPKMMRWGNHSEEFVRPVKWILALLGEKVVPMTLFGKTSQNTTRGHRFYCTEDIIIDSAANYQKTLLDQGKVIVDFEERKRLIKQQANAIIEGKGNAIIDDKLLEEITGLVEWPIAVLGNFEREFLEVPEEALISSMQGHQKYFPVRESNGKLSNQFITISNIDSTHPQSVIEGNEKVIRPRLADARFFYDTDRKNKLEAQLEKLKSVLFQNQLGSLYDKTQRVKKMALKIAKAFSADSDHVERAATLAKCDLMTEMVGEFPHLQGIMGRYYADYDGEPEAVALALDEQYMPRFSGDSLPQTASGSALAVAERMDTLVGLFGIGKPPKGAKDPFALRRASLGVLRILMKREVQLSLVALIQMAQENFQPQQLTQAGVEQKLLDFLYQRFNAWYLEQGIDANVIHAVMAKRPEVVSDFDARIKAVAHFNTLPEAKALAAANKRVGNILNKVSSKSITFQNDLLCEAAEIKLAESIVSLNEKLTPLFEQKNYQQAMIELATIRESVDAFFDEVMVVVDDEAIKNNRIALLQQLRALFLQVADISLLQ